MRESTKLPTQIVVTAITLSVFAVAYYSRDLYELYMQEDHFVEWLTATLFAIGGGIRLRQAVKQRHLFDGLVALFSFFVAGEEFSWGQRLVGYTPADLFLSHNVQQEATLHNFADVLGRPKWSLIAVLAGYGLLLPLAYRFAPTRKVMERMGATAPPNSLAPWFAVTIIMLVWYPLSYSGEWLELIASVLFLGAATTTPTFLVSLAVGAVAALALTVVSGHRSGGEPATACARAEVTSLLSDITGGAGSIDLLAARSLEKRVWSAISDGDIDAGRMSKFQSTRCAGSIASSRRRYAVDPWGSSYWVRVHERADDTADVEVYSFGPNRRRDESSGAASDDIAQRRSIDPYSAEPMSIR